MHHNPVYIHKTHCAPSVSRQLLQLPHMEAMKKVIRNVIATGAHTSITIIYASGCTLRMSMGWTLENQPLSNQPNEPTNHTNTHTHIMLAASYIRIILDGAITLAITSCVRLAASQTQQGTRVCAVRNTGVVIGCSRPRPDAQNPPFDPHTRFT